MTKLGLCEKPNIGCTMAEPTHLLPKTCNYTKMKFVFFCWKRAQDKRYETYLIGHIEFVREKKRPFKCESCNFTSISSRDLSERIACVHDKMKPFKCEKCEYTTSYNKNLMRHKENCKGKKNTS